MYTQLLAIIGPIMLISGIGFVWVRRGSDFRSDFVRELVFYLGGPCLVISSLTGSDLSGASLLAMGRNAVLIAAVCALGFGILIRLQRRDLRVLLPPMVFSNNGNMGLPLSLFAFGDTGLTLGVAYFVAMTVLHFTFGVVLVSGRFDPKALLRSPFVLAAVISLVMLALELELPAVLDNTIRLLGQMTIPLMLLTLGVSLASLKVRDLATATVYGGLRVLVGFAIGLALASFLGLQGAERGVLLIQASMPSAVFTYLMAEHYQRSPQTVAGIIVMSTLVAFVCLPLVVWLATGSGGPA
ncbi:MAG: AEC family transporter [Gammaproteobacteria bacterium]